MKKSAALFICIILCLSLCSCQSYEDAPEAAFSSDTVTQQMDGFSITYPEDWSVLEEYDETADYGEIVFEAGSPIREDLICSSVIVVRGSATEEQKLSKVVTLEDVNDIVTRLSQGLGTTLTLKESSAYTIGGRETLYFSADFTRDDNAYTIAQTYFLHNGDVYILTVVAIEDHDAENALQIPFTLSFAEDSEL